MVKTKIVENGELEIKTKSSQKSLGFKDLFLSLFKFDTFNQKIEIKKLLIYNLILLSLLTIIMFFSNRLTNYSIYDNFTIAIYGFIGVSLLLFLGFGIFYIFINAYEIKKKPFFESLMIFFALVLPFIVVSNFLNLLSSYFLLEAFTTLVLLIIVSITIYFGFLFVLTYSKYYQANPYKIVSSILLCMILNLLILIVSYLTTLINLIA